MRVGGRAALYSTPGAKATDFSRFCAHLCPAHFSRFDPKVPHFLLATSSPGWIYKFIIEGRDANKTLNGLRCAFLGMEF